VTEPQIAQICGAEAAANVRWREDSPAILRWHGLEGGWRAREPAWPMQTKYLETPELKG
jgi:hypothetical protein